MGSIPALRGRASGEGPRALRIDALRIRSFFRQDGATEGLTPEDDVAAANKFSVDV